MTANPADVPAVHRAVVELLTDVRRRYAWRTHPQRYAADAVGGRGRDLIARLDPDRVEAAALNLDLRRIAKPTGGSPTSTGASTERPSADGDERWPLSNHLVGLGFWPDLYVDFADSRLVRVWEHRVDDYLDDVRLLEELADRGPVVMHSVGLSLGSVSTATEFERLRRIGAALRAAGADELSDHLAFSRIGDVTLEHFIPVWRVEEALDIVVENVERIQDILGVRLALENIAPILDLGGDMTTAEFLNAVVRRTGCGVLLDVTNLNLCSANGFCDAADELDVLDLDAVVGVHLAGGDEVDGIHFDAHAFPVSESDVAGLATLMPSMPNCHSVIVERDARRGEVEEIRKDLRSLHAALG